MNILPLSAVLSHKQGSLTRLSAPEISTALGFNPNIAEDEEQVHHSWGFSADGVECAIWDYNGSEGSGRFSFFGPREVFVQLFGAERVES